MYMIAVPFHSRWWKTSFSINDKHTAILKWLFLVCTLGRCWENIFSEFVGYSERVGNGKDCERLFWGYGGSCGLGGWRMDKEEEEVKLGCLIQWGTSKRICLTQPVNLPIECYLFADGIGRGAQKDYHRARWSWDGKTILLWPETLVQSDLNTLVP